MFWEFGNREPTPEVHIREREYRKSIAKLTGLNTGNIYFGFQDTPNDAAIYFCDGLKWKCFKLAEKLGKGKVYINSDDFGIMREARGRGFRTLDGKIEDIIASYLKKSGEKNNDK